MITRRNLIRSAAGLALLSNKKARAWSHGSAAGGLQFNLILDSSWSGAPSTWQSGSVSINQAVALISAAYPNVNATINLHVGYQTIWLSAGTPASPISASTSAGVYLNQATISYSTIRSAMAGLSFQSTSLSNLLANTPAGASLNGNSSFIVTSATCKALGLFGFSGGPTSSTDSIIDGSIGIGSGWADAKILGVMLHEMTHVLGRVKQTAPFVFSRFTAAGTRDFGSSISAYFSLDGGNTSLDSYDPTSSDVSDFSNTGTASLDCFNASQANGANQFLSTLDNQLMNSMGFQ